VKPRTPYTPLYPGAFHKNIKANDLENLQSQLIDSKRNILSHQTGHKQRKMCPKKEKREQAPALQNVVIYRCNYSTD